MLSLSETLPRPRPRPTGPYPIDDVDDANLHVFEFERDFAASLRCIPMAVRLKLDLSGIKVSLREWSRFTRDDRAALLHAACSSPAEIGAYRAGLVELIAARSGVAATELPVATAPAWDDIRSGHAIVAAYAISLGLASPDIARWAMLKPLQRFALLKLTRSGHDNVNFVPALYEFALLGYDASDISPTLISTEPSSGPSQGRL
jgi:hypothetical protein